MWKNKFELLYRWIRLTQSGVTLEKLFIDRELRRIALYGYDKIAECILYELRKSYIQVIAIVDRKGDKIFIDYPAYKPNEISDLKIDAIVMMPVDKYQNIKAELCQYTEANIISIEEVLYEL